LCIKQYAKRNYRSTKGCLAVSKKDMLFLITKINKQTTIIVSNTIFQKIISKKYKAVNKYGISKSITYDKIKNCCKKYNLKLKSIFITNPWGILEEKRLNYYMIINWLKNKDVVISYPNYIRDNIHIDKLTKNYIKMIHSKSKKIDYFPSGYCSTNEAFIIALKKRFEKHFNKKVNLNFIYNLKHIQPTTRINSKKIKKKIVIKENLKSYFNYYQKLINKF